MYRVYLFEQVELVTEDFIKWALPLLPEERRRKALRYRQPTDRKTCVITYLMLKIALKECFQITDFSIMYGKYGKPYLAEYTDVFFNISHCKHGCAVAVATCPVGVDIQDIRQFSWDVAKRVCCREELEVLEKSTDKEREFVRMWAMKESYVKMIGEGIGAGLNGINTLIEKNMEVTNREKAIVSVCGQKPAKQSYKKRRREG